MPRLDQITILKQKIERLQAQIDYLEKIEEIEKKQAKERQEAEKEN